MKSSKGEVLDLVVVGGGLGGLATAIAARQAGRSVVVLERDVGPSEVDTGITLWSFAIRALRALGVEDVVGPGGRLDYLVSYSAVGRLLSEIDVSSIAREAGAPTFDVHRADLQATLTEALGTEHVRYGARCVRAREDSGVAIAELGDGSEVAGRLLVGADGVRSVVRPYVAPGVAVEAADVGAWRGILELDEGAVPNGCHLRVYGPSGIFGAARLDRRRVRWYAGGRVSPGTRGDWAQLAARFGRWCEPVASIVAASREGSVLYNDTPRFGPLRRWNRGRVALVGDAAHGAVPTLGVSGGLALADGLFLGTAVIRGVDPPALDSYARRREAVGRRIQREAEAFRHLLNARRPRMVAARDRVLRAPFDRFQACGVTHLAHGAEASVAAELLPGFLRPANRPGSVRPALTRTTACGSLSTNFD